MNIPHPLFRDYLTSQIPEGEPEVKRYAKAVAAVCGGAAMVLSTGVLEENVEIWINAALALATAFGVYAVPNKPAAPDVV